MSIMRRRKRMPGEERRRQLLELSVRLFAERGYWNTGTNDIAREAQISEPTIYRHFSGKDDLFLAAAEEAIQELLSALEGASISDLEALRAWLREEARRGPALAMAGRLLNEARRPPFREGAALFLERVRETLRRRLGGEAAAQAVEVLVGNALLAAGDLLDGAS